MDITEIGTLKVANVFAEKGYAVDKFVALATTKFKDATILIGATDLSVLTINELTDTKEYSFIHGIEVRTVRQYSENYKAIVIDKRLFIFGDGNLDVYDIIIDKNKMITNIHIDPNFKKKLYFPRKKKKVVSFDIYKLYKVGSTTKLSFIYVDEDPIMKTGANGELTIESTNIELQRIYTKYKASITAEEIDLKGGTAEELKPNQYIAVMKKHYDDKLEEDKYYINNRTVSFNDGQLDDKYGSGYYKNMNEKNVPPGEMFFGVPEDFYDDIVHVGYFQSRVFFLTNDKIYFSKTRETLDFVNGIKGNDAFFIEPTQINGSTPKLLEVATGKELFILSDIGVYALNYSQSLSPMTVIIDIATDVAYKKNALINEGMLYYISVSDKIKALEKVGGTANGVNYQNHNVENYDINFTPSFIGMIYHNGGYSVLAKGYREDDERIYDYIGESIFRKTRKDTGIHNDFFNVKKVMLITRQNTIIVEEEEKFKHSSVVISPPNLFLEGKGSYLTEEASRIERIAIKTVNVNKDKVKSLKLSGREVQMREPNPDKNTNNILSVRESKKASLDTTIEIETFETRDSIEVLGIEMLIDVKSN